MGAQIRHRKKRLVSYWAKMELTIYKLRTMLTGRILFLTYPQSQGWSQGRKTVFNTAHDNGVGDEGRTLLSLATPSVTRKASSDAPLMLEIGVGEINPSLPKRPFVDIIGLLCMIVTDVKFELVQVPWVPALEPEIAISTPLYAHVYRDLLRIRHSPTRRCHTRIGIASRFAVVWQRLTELVHYVHAYRVHEHSMDQYSTESEQWSPHLPTRHSLPELQPASTGLVFASMVFRNLGTSSICKPLSEELLLTATEHKGRHSYCRVELLPLVWECHLHSISNSPNPNRITHVQEDGSSHAIYVSWWLLSGNCRYKSGDCLDVHGW